MSDGFWFAVTAVLLAFVAHACDWLGQPLAALFLLGAAVALAGVAALVRQTPSGGS